jgi:hypothetical protein
MEPPAVDRMKTCMQANVQSTDHKLIPTRNVSHAAMQGSASGSNVRYYPT